MRKMRISVNYADPHRRILSDAMYTCRPSRLLILTLQCPDIHVVLVEDFYNNICAFQFDQLRKRNSDQEVVLSLGIGWSVVHDLFRISASFMIGRRKRMSKLLFSRTFLIGQCWGKMQKKSLNHSWFECPRCKVEGRKFFVVLHDSVCQTTAVHLHYQVSKAWVSGAHEFDYLLY